MTVVGLHPEELFDKLLTGELSPAEAERLRQHLRACPVCRFEHAARLDFQAEALELAVAAPPPDLPLRPLPLVHGGGTQSAPSLAAPGRRGRRRLLVVGLAAAALITASAAVAASVGGRAPWHTLGAFFSEPPPRGAANAARAKSKAVTPVRAGGSVALPASTPAAPSAGPASLELVTPPPLAPRDGTARSSSRIRPNEARSEKEANAPAPAREANESPTAATLFADANQARRARDFGRATGLYHLLQERYPGSPEAELSRVTLALLQLESGEAQAALRGFERYLAGSSRGLEAEALVGRARALGRLGRRDLEEQAWREVQRKYPRSIYGLQATERLSALGQP